MLLFKSQAKRRATPKQPLVTVPTTTVTTSASTAAAAPKQIEDGPVKKVAESGTPEKESVSRAEQEEKEEEQEEEYEERVEDGEDGDGEEDGEVDGGGDGEAAGDGDVVSSLPTVVKARKFTEVGISPWLSRNCAAMGLHIPTLIQEQCIPPILQGKDVIGSAKTGSGKTAAFALPILQQLSLDPYGIFAVVVTPTRELAIQIADQFRALGANIGLKCVVLIGGVLRMQQALDLSRRPHVVIGTPGRLCDHLRAGEMEVKRARFLVLDEADRLLDSAFATDIAFIVQSLPKKRQTLLFSATMTNNLRKLESLSMSPDTDTNTGNTKGLFRYDACPKYESVESLKQEYMFMPAAAKDSHLVYLLRNEFEEASTIVFLGKCSTAHLVSEMLRLLGIPCTPLHSLLSQADRTKSLYRFRKGVSRVLIATDVASRGLDIPEVELVINFDMPSTTKDYTHRVGRTARIGKQGTSISLVCQYDIERVLTIETDTKVKMKEHLVNEDDVLKHLSESAKARKMAYLRLEESGFWDKVKDQHKKNYEAKKASGQLKRKRAPSHSRKAAAAAAAPSAAESANGSTSTSSSTSTTTRDAKRSRTEKS
eukprot:TRINITY_DN5457_c0_g1_i1.p1 TRINITY_DN5457_c0_g1~~TRINITY_DN5457_c0_g1_i1.p1  ORF type:complete len:596 (+),score=125.96 TRINITY_DN5457_c0_g1_i1:56-1843(+)